MINFYRLFLRDTARVLAPLTNALKVPGKSLKWSPVLSSAFSATKLLLALVPVLTHPVPGAAISLAVDASDSRVGTVFQQRLRGSWSPLAFFSKKLSSAQVKYSPFDRELLAAYSSIRHFRFLLEAQDFTLFTDHKPLTLALFRSSPPWAARQTGHLAYISEFTSNIVHIPGSKNVVTDALSHPSSPVLVPSSALPLFSTTPLDLSATGFDFLLSPFLAVILPFRPVFGLQFFSLHCLRAVSSILCPLRCVLRFSAATGSFFSSPSAVHLSTQTLTSWCTCFSEAAVLQVCMAVSG